MPDALPPCCSQVHAINERILDFGEALRRALPEGEAADIGRTSVAEVTQVSLERRAIDTGERGCSSHQAAFLIPLHTPPAYLSSFSIKMKSAGIVSAPPPPSPPLQEPVWVAGRIVAEWETSGALNEQSVLLEGSREASSGVRVRLDLSQLPSFRIFPGQVRRVFILGREACWRRRGPGLPGFGVRLCEMCVSV